MAQYLLYLRYDLLYLRYDETVEMFQSETITCLRQFREHVQFSIQFTRVLWSSEKTIEVEKSRDTSFGHPREEFFLCPLAREQNYFLA